MFIILEGADGTGKSTLSDAIVRALDPGRLYRHGPLTNLDMRPGTHVISRAQPTRSYLDEYLPTYAPGINVNVVADRWHVGESIYGPLYRNSHVDPLEEETLENLLIAMGVLMVIVTAPINVVRARISERGEDFLKPEHLKQVLDAYTNYAQCVRRVSTILVNTIEPTAASVSRVIKIACALETEAVVRRLTS